MKIRASTSRVLLPAFIALVLFIPLTVRAGYPLPFDSDHWEGVEYCYNGYTGPWLPSMDGGCADFVSTDYCWRMARTKFTVARDTGTWVASVLPRLSSGGDHTDEAHIGFGDGYSHYVGQFVGITLSAGIVYLGTSIDYFQQAIGSYAPGVAFEIQLFVDASGLLVVSGAASGSIDANSMLPENFHILLDVADSEDGIRFCNAVVPAETESWGALKNSYR